MTLSSKSNFIFTFHVLLFVQCLQAINPFQGIFYKEYTMFNSQLSGAIITKAKDKLL